MSKNISYVWVTHPCTPNLTGNARGRVIHIMRKDNKFPFRASFCGMKVVEKATSYDLAYRRVCTPCAIQNNQVNAPERDDD